MEGGRGAEREEGMCDEYPKIRCLKEKGEFPYKRKGEDTRKVE